MLLAQSSTGKPAAHTAVSSTKQEEQAAGHHLSSWDFRNYRRNADYDIYCGRYSTYSPPCTCRHFVHPVFTARRRVFYCGGTYRIHTHGASGTSAVDGFFGGNS